MGVGWTPRFDRSLATLFSCAVEPGSEREVLTLALGIAIAVVSVVKRHVFRGLPRARRLGIAGASMLVAWTATVLEHLVFFEVLDTVEHLAYFGAALALTSWIVSVQRGFAEPRGP